MRIYVDADGCPRAVLEVVYRASNRRQVDVTLVANRAIRVPNGHPRISTLQVASGLDVADDQIVEMVDPEDLVITSDLPLAADVVAKGATAIDHRGCEYTEANVRERLSIRDFMTEMRASDLTGGGGPPPYDNKAKGLFANSLDRWLTAALRKR